MATNSESLALALRHHQEGRLQSAEELYRLVLQDYPGNADAWHLLGMAAHQAGRNDEAVAHIGKAIALDSRQAIFHNNLSLVYRSQGRLAEALTACDEAVRLNPGYAIAHNSRGLILQAQGRFAEAETCYREALWCRPDLAEAHCNLGIALKLQGKLPEAIASYREALRCRPGYAEAQNNLGVALRQQGRTTEALACYREALRLKPAYADAHQNLGTLLHDQGDLSAATACFARALELAPRDGLRIKAALVLPVILESTEEMHRQRRRLEANVARLSEEKLMIEDPGSTVSGTVFELAYHGENDRDLQAAIASLYARAAPSLNFIAPHCGPAAAATGPRRPLRIGFISKFFYNQTVGLLTAGIIRTLSRDDFRVILFRFPGKDDDVARFIGEGTDKVVTLPIHLGLARQQIAEQQLDVLFYPDIGMDPFTYCLAFARLAPVQCVTWGHPITTGVPAIDYFISSELLETADADEHYTERLVRLKTLPAYYYRPSPFTVSKGRPFFGLAEEHHLYGCLQSLFKFHPDFDALLSAILRRDPQGRLVLVESKQTPWKDLLLQRWTRVMPDVVDRVVFLPRQSREDFLQLSAACDVLLDPIHFGSGNTCYEAVALGVPLVTWPGRFLRGRVTLGVYRKMGVLDCVAASADEYADIAVRLGNDPEHRAAVRAKLQAASAVVFEDLGAVRELEQFFRDAVDRAGSRP